MRSKWFVAMIYIRFALNLLDVEDMLFEVGIDLCREIIRLRWLRFGPLFAADIRGQRISTMRVVPW